MTTVLLEKLTRSSSLLSSKDHLLDATAKWDSLKTYVLLAFSLSACNLNYDTYSQLVTPVIFIEMFGIQLTIGSSYAFMDFFIRQYTGLLDFNATLNPILRSINYAIILQNCFWLIVYSVETAESLKTTVIVLKSKIPDWYHCPPGVSKCMNIWDLFGTCRKFNVTNISDTSMHYYYMSEIQENKQQTERLVLLAIIWLVVFFVSSAAPFTVIKFVKFTSFMKIVCIIINFVIMVVMKNQLFGRAVSDIMSMNAQTTVTQSMNHVASIYCIGLIGVYDFGTMTPYTTIDNAVILYSCVFATLSMMVSITCRMMFLNAKRCFRLSNVAMRRLYAIYAIYPLTMDFLHVQKLVALIMFVNLTLGSVGHLVYTTACTARMLASNYRRVKEMYLCGVICFIGFLTSFWLHSEYRPLLSGVKHSSVAMGYFLGALKSAIVMWAYGVKRFSTDINFWLGFKPTIYWRCCWVLLPIPLCYSTYACLVDVVIRHNHLKGNPFRAYIAWMSLTLTVLTLVQIKTITNFVFKNNLLGAFRCSAKYGPPDRVTRKRRRKFHEELNLELCDHECNMVDDSFDCMHEMYEETEHELKTIIELDEDNVESSESSLVEDSRKST